MAALTRAGAARAQRQVKAAYLYQFAGFVEWPEGSFARSDSALGGMINFVVADQKLRVEVALKPLASARLRISARTLSAAYNVRGAP
ncbi:hypothetical protein ACFDR9_001097 [Janthinobacterium sp. CG_23.3]|uniref:hypothetical protein n=1 Tax=Janthinobacterium sp. CG_23.3 TaxID=3349634 RepID=UPI0038D3E11C